MAAKLMQVDAHCSGVRLDVPCDGVTRDTQVNKPTRITPTVAKRMHLEYVCTRRWIRQARYRVAAQAARMDSITIPARVGMTGTWWKASMSALSWNLRCGLWFGASVLGLMQKLWPATPHSSKHQLVHSWTPCKRDRRRSQGAFSGKYKVASSYLS